MSGDLVGSKGGMGKVVAATGAFGVVPTATVVVIVVAAWNGLLAIAGVTGCSGVEVDLLLDGSENHDERPWLQSANLEYVWSQVLAVSLPVR
ncbi:unnamed protein product [Prunus armeniaca]|uniref:Uncharacterized protein n=1 Tax=Prunus armeniaca TaxID=36596 RepID=A0A6J5XN51_PRUAR|nr:unnamed protein product [Prunus armeniaca]